MMDYIPEPEHINLSNGLTQVVTAHEAVNLGIATHAQKEAAARDTRRRELEAARKLQAGTRALE